MEVAFVIGGTQIVAIDHAQRTQRGRPAAARTVIFLRFQRQRAAGAGRSARMVIFLRM